LQNTWFPDEIDTLIEKYNQMLNRLKSTSLELEKTQLSLFQNEKLASIGTLASGVAHEINTPVTGLLYSIKRIKKSPENIGQITRYLELMENSAKHINTIVQGLLDFSKRDDFEFTQVNVVDIVQDALKMAGFKLKSVNIAVSVHFDNKACYVPGSKNHLEQVLINVIINSVEAIEEKQVTNPGHKGKIVIDIRSAPDLCTIGIKDNGTGISKEKLLHVFDPFYTTKGVGKGTGLGLSVSYNIMKAHNGVISVKSEPGEGTTVIITIKKQRP